MQRFIRPFSALIFLVLLFLGPTACINIPSDQSVPSRPDNICAIFKEKPDWLQAAYDTKHRWGTPIPQKMAIIWYESRFKADARPIKYRSFWGDEYASSAYGYSQALNGTWEWYKQDANRPNAQRGNFADAIDFVGWYMDKSRKMISLSPYDTYNQYLAYHEGQRGFSNKTYAKKPWLIGVAQKVRQRQKQYQEQLSHCS